MPLVVSQQRSRPRRIARAAVATAALSLGLASALAEEAATTAAAPPVAFLPADMHPQFWFGVAVENIPPAISRQLKLRPDQGVMVVAVFSGSPADKAGIHSDDLLIEINGKPLTSQDDLAKAANTTGTVQIGAGKVPPQLMQVSQVTYLRAGDHFSTQLTPELRPADMQVSGANIQRFSPGGTVSPRVPEVRNVVLSNGSNVQYGPGYQVDASAQANLTVLQQAVGKSQSIIVTQESDGSGHTKITIRDGSKTYTVEAGKLDQVPANIRPLAEHLIAQAQQVMPATGLVVESAGTPSTDDRLQRLEQQNEELKQQLGELKTLLLKAGQNSSGAPASIPPAK